MTRSNSSTTVPDTKATTLPTHKATVVTSTSLTTLMLHCTPITNSYFVHAPPNKHHGVHGPSLEHDPSPDAHHHGQLLHTDTHVIQSEHVLTPALR